MIRTLTVVFAFAAVVSQASAAPVTFTYYGAVTSKNTGVTPLPAPFNNPGIVSGSPMSISYTFESGTPDSLAGPGTGQYFAITQIVLTTGPATQTFNFAGPYGQILVSDDLPIPPNTTDRYGLLSTNLGSGYDYLQVQLDDLNYSVFNSDVLPLTPPPISAFDFASGRLKGNGLIFSFIDFRLTAVPEPHTLGLAVFAAVLRRRR